MQTWYNFVAKDLLVDLEQAQSQIQEKITSKHDEYAEVVLSIVNKFGVESKLENKIRDMMRKKMMVSKSKPYNFAKDTDDFERAENDDSITHESSGSLEDIERRDEKEETTRIVTRGKKTIESEDDVLQYVKSKMGEGGGGLKIGDAV